MLTDTEKRLIGGSDAAAVAGISSYKTPLDVFRRIRDGHEEPETAPMRRGVLMEPVIREMARVELGLHLLGGAKFRHGSEPWRASLDDQALGEVIEFKSVSTWAAGGWGEEGTDQVPAEYLAQAQWYCSLSTLPVARIVALIGVDDLRQYVIESDMEFQEMLHEAARRFWKDYILTDTPPPVDASESCADWLKAKHPASNGVILPATKDAEFWVERLAEAKSGIKELEGQEKAARNQLLALIGDADGVEGLASYKTSKGRASVDWEAVCFEAKIKKELIERNTRRTPFRTLRLLKGSNNE